jgi:DNA-binding beta-propeller fold protein YncE
MQYHLTYSQKIVISGIVVGLIIGALGSLAYRNPSYIKEAATGYHLSSTLQIGGSSAWDYLTFNNNTRQLFIAHSDPGVTVVDVDNQKVVGIIEQTKGVHGIALAPEFNRGFTSNASRGTVTVFDIAALKPVIEVTVGSGPDCIIYDEFSKRVFVINGGSSNATAIDAASGTVVGTVELDSKKPEFAVSDDKGTIYVNLQDKNEIETIDTNDLKVRARWTIGHGEKPTAIAIDKEKGRLFIGCRNSVMVIMDASNGNILSELPIGPGVDAVAYDFIDKLVFTANSNGTITVIGQKIPDQYAVVDTIWTLPGARTFALDPETHNLYTVTAKINYPAKVGDRPVMIPDTFEMLTISR